MATRITGKQRAARKRNIKVAQAAKKGGRGGSKGASKIKIKKKSGYKGLSISQKKSLNLMRGTGRMGTKVGSKQHAGLEAMKKKGLVRKSALSTSKRAGYHITDKGSDWADSRFYK